MTEFKHAKPVNAKDKMSNSRHDALRSLDPFNDHVVVGKKKKALTFGILIPDFLYVMRARCLFFGVLDLQH